MINKIVEVFTKPQIEMSAMDSFIQSIVILITIALIVLISIVILTIKDEIKEKLRREK
ncbi:MAG TPA: hypothetical protein IAC14_08870 [Candidatus Scybalomonas excrementigallinarum]|nr:hypothetical protein [Candidatus Scybalomonas excrementigallinarum]